MHGLGSRARAVAAEPLLARAVSPLIWARTRGSDDPNLDSHEATAMACPGRLGHAWVAVAPTRVDATVMPDCLEERQEERGRGETREKREEKRKKKRNALAFYM